MPIISAALCAATDDALVDETFKFILSGAKDQDVYMFIAFLANNIKTRRRMANFFKENYDEVG
jgi:aminopeptidase 2